MSSQPTALQFPIYSGLRNGHLHSKRNSKLVPSPLPLGPKSYPMWDRCDEWTTMWGAMKPTRNGHKHIHIEFRSTTQQAFDRHHSFHQHHSQLSYLELFDCRQNNQAVGTSQVSLCQYWKFRSTSSYGLTSTAYDAIDTQVRTPTEAFGKSLRKEYIYNCQAAQLWWKDV